MFGNMTTDEEPSANTERLQTKPGTSIKKEDTKVATLNRENIPPRRLSCHVTSLPETASHDTTKVRRSSHHVVMRPERRKSNVKDTLSQQPHASPSMKKSGEQLSTGKVDPRCSKRSSSMVTSGLSTAESHLLRHLSQKSIVDSQQDKKNESTYRHNAAADQQRNTSKKGTLADPQQDQQNASTFRPSAVPDQQRKISKKDTLVNSQQDHENASTSRQNEAIDQQRKPSKKGTISDSQRGQENASTSRQNASAYQQQNTPKKDTHHESKQGSHASVGGKPKKSIHKSHADVLMRSTVEDAKVVVSGTATAAADPDHPSATVAKPTPQTQVNTDNKEEQRVIDQTIVSIKKAVAAHTGVTDHKNAEQMSIGHSNQSIDVYGKEEPAFLYKFMKFVDADPSHDVKHIARKLVSRIEPLLSQHLTDNNWKKVKYYIEVINTIQNLRTPTKPIDPEEMLNCGYLRLSKSNVEKLEAMCRQRGVDPGIHAHSEIIGYDNVGIFEK